MRIAYACRHFSKPSLPNLYKYGGTRINLKSLLADYDIHKKNIANRKLDADIELVSNLYKKFVAAKKNFVQIKDDSTRVKLIKEHSEIAKSYKATLKAKQEALEALEKDMMKEALKIPNTTHESTPIGNKSCAKIISTHGHKPEHFDKSYGELSKDYFDYEAGAKVSNSKFSAYIKGLAVELYFSMLSFSMDFFNGKAYTSIITPSICKKQLDKCFGLSSDTHNLEDDLTLASVPATILSGMLCSSIVHKNTLPLNYFGLTHCFGKTRSEISLSSQTTQISLFSFCDETQSNNLLEKHVGDIVDLYNTLGLHFKVVEMPTEELEPYAYRKLEVQTWIPSEKQFYKTAVVTHCSDYPATRLNALYTDEHNKRNPLHIVQSMVYNIEEIIMIIAEYYQRKDRGLCLPECIKKYNGLL